MAVLLLTLILIVLLFGAAAVKSAFRYLLSGFAIVCAGVLAAVFFKPMLYVALALAAIFAPIVLWLLREALFPPSRATSSESAQRADETDLETERTPEQKIAVLEGEITSRGAAPFTYRRLALLYRSHGTPRDELRVVTMALAEVPRSNHHYTWFEERHSALCVPGGAQQTVQADGPASGGPAA